MADTIIIKPRERQAIIQSLRAGMVPQIGVQHIQVGRKREILEIIKDIDNLCDGGSFARFIIGEFGSGKTYFLTLAKLLAHHKKLVVVSADITTERILCASNGKAQALYSELIRNMSIKTEPSGGALETVIQTWADSFLRDNNGLVDNYDRIDENLAPLRKLANYSDFCLVLQRYLKAYAQDDKQQKECALRWLRGEYKYKTEARNDLGVRTIIKDEDFYPALKLMAGFVVLAGYPGLLVCLDEMAVLTRLSSITLKKNLETILTIINEVIPGTTSRLGFLFGGTNEFYMDSRRGMFSYDALKGRLKSNEFASEERPDFTGPVILLSQFNLLDLKLLCENLRRVFALGDESKYLVTDEQILLFLNYLTGQMGADAYLSPRNSIKTFVGLLSQLENYPETNIETYLGKQTIEAAREDDLPDEIEADLPSADASSDLFRIR